MSSPSVCTYRFDDRTEVYVTWDEQTQYWHVFADHDEAVAYTADEYQYVLDNYYEDKRTTIE